MLDKHLFISSDQNKRRLYNKSRLLNKLFYHLSRITQYINYLEPRANPSRRIISQITRVLEQTHAIS